MNLKRKIPKKLVTHRPAHRIEQLQTLLIHLSPSEQISLGKIQFFMIFVFFVNQSWTNFIFQKNNKKSGSEFLKSFNLL